MRGDGSENKGFNIDMSVSAIIIDFDVGAVTGEHRFDLASPRLVVETARAQGRQTFAHCSGENGLATAARAGIGSIEHGFFMNGETLAIMRDNQVAWMPTFCPVHFQWAKPEAVGWSAETVGNKVKAGEKCGVESFRHTPSSDAPEAGLLALIQRLNADASVHGILVQLPLPPHIDERRVLEAIAVDKDMDGFHLYNVGGLVVDNNIFPPCTPYGLGPMTVTMLIENTLRSAEMRLGKGLGIGHEGWDVAAAL